MLITERKFGIFSIANIYFADDTTTHLDFDVVTYHTYKNWGEIKGFERKKCLTTTIDLNQSIDVIWNKINRQNKRHILRSEKNGTRVTLSDNYEWFHKQNKKCMKKKKFADPIGLNILPSKFMQKYGILFIAENQDEILGGNLYFQDENNVIFIEGVGKNIGGNIENKKLSTDANCYLHWEAMQYFKDNNFIKYDFGNLLWNDNNTNHQMLGAEYLKRSFGGDIISRYQYLKFNSRFNELLFDSWNFFSNICIKQLNISAISKPDLK
jgi:hypothetical protein